jgi:selenocysteine lyase/cysteine desulfurase
MIEEFSLSDGLQTAGHIPLNLSSIELDAFVFTGHKGLFGMPGIGGFCIRNPDPVLPVRMGGTGTNSKSLDQPGDLPERYEIGTHNYPGVASLIAGISFLQTIGMDTLQRKADRQIEYFMKELSSEPGITIYNPKPDLPIIACNITGLDNDDVGYILARKDNVIVRTGLHCAPLLHKAIDDGAGCIRISPSWFTTDEECQIAAAAIKEIAHHANYQVESP